MTEAQHIVFDFDGTIADTFSMALSTFNPVARELRIREIAPDDFEMIRSQGSRELMKTFGVSRWRLTRVMLRLRKEMTKAIDQTKVIEGMREALTELQKKGYELGILTSNSVKNVELFLELHDMKHLFNFIYSGKNIFGKKKVMLKMMRREKIDRERIVYVGDETRDVEASHKARIPVIAVTWGLNNRAVLEKSRPTRITDNPQDILPFVQELLG